MSLNPSDRVSHHPPSRVTLGVFFCIGVCSLIVGVFSRRLQSGMLPRHAPGPVCSWCHLSLQCHCSILSRHPVFPGSHWLPRYMMCRIQILLHKPLTHQLGTAYHQVFLSFNPRTLSGQWIRSVGQTLRVSGLASSSSPLSSSTASWMLFLQLVQVCLQPSSCHLP